MLKGITYIVRPRMEPVNRPRRVSIISPGSAQLLVGPAALGLREQIKVRSSTRATSLGSERHRKLSGRFSSFRRINVPASTSCWHRRSYSSWEPSHHTTSSGWHSPAISATHSFRRVCVT
jgi:hypothetical protein